MQSRSLDDLSSERRQGFAKMFKMGDNEASKKLKAALEKPDLKAASKIVAENESGIDDVLMEEISSYKKELRSKGLSERQIRRKIKSKFNIVEVPNHVE